MRNLFSFCLWSLQEPISWRKWEGTTWRPPCWEEAQAITSFPITSSNLSRQPPNTYIFPLSSSKTQSHVPTGLLHISAWKSHSTSIMVLMLETLHLISSLPISLPSPVAHLGNWFQHPPRALAKSQESAFILLSFEPHH